MSGITDRLYEALKAVEWVSPSYIFYCPWCGSHKYVFIDGEQTDGRHTDDCQRQAALAETDEIRKRWDQQLCRDIATGE